MRCRPGGEGAWEPREGTLAEDNGRVGAPWQRTVGEWGLPVNEESKAWPRLTGVSSLAPLLSMITVLSAQ